MAEFQELIKNFDRIRDYMRQFYVYGFKVRGDYDGKSGRTYDNERRRIEGWMAGYVKSDYGAKGKQVYIDVDSKRISQNPLYKAWKSKSVTDNDILLHFFLADMLLEHPEGLTAGEMSDGISEEYGVAFESQTVRNKLKEYEALGIFTSKREGKRLIYRLASRLPAEESPLWPRLLTAVSFFQGEAPAGVVGSTILDREDEENRLFQFKHLFLVHTLEDGILLKLLEAMGEKRSIRAENKSSRTGQVSRAAGVPLKIFVSSRTGRRYLCLYSPEFRRFNNLRLDSIVSVELLEPYEGYDRAKEDLKRNLDKCWGVSFGNRNSRQEEICLKLFIDEKKEPYVLNRLYREGRGGEVERIRENEFLYRGLFFDTNEMLSWVKSFTGRILDIQGSNAIAVAKVVRDWETMYRMYGTAGDAGENSGENSDGNTGENSDGNPGGDRTGKENRKKEGQNGAV